jgi:hypothetical protein
VFLPVDDTGEGSRLNVLMIRHRSQHVMADVSAVALSYTLISVEMMYMFSFLGDWDFQKKYQSAVVG